MTKAGITMRIVMTIKKEKARPETLTHANIGSKGTIMSKEMGSIFPDSIGMAIINKITMIGPRYPNNLEATHKMLQP